MQPVIPGGMGERSLFRTLMHHVAFTWPESARKNVAYIAEFGRWDDLLCLLNTPAGRQTIRVIKDQLAEDEAALISQAMGLYCAERCNGYFHNHLITFESRPHLIKVRGANLRDKLKYIGTLPWGGSTDMEAVFDLILRTAVKNNVKQEELPSVIYIFSDMEFNYCMRNADKTVYENARELFEANGYQMPAVVFHNVNSWQMQTPVTAHTRGTALTSGAATNTMGHKFDRNITPMEHMLRVLESERYAMIRA